MKFAQGKRLGPRIVTSGPKLDGPKPAWPGSIPVANPEEARRAVETLQQMGAGFVKLYFSAIGDDTYKAIIDEAHERKLQVTGHLPWDMLATEAVDAGRTESSTSVGIFCRPAPAKRRSYGPSSANPAGPANSTTESFSTRSARNARRRCCSKWPGAVPP